MRILRAYMWIISSRGTACLSPLGPSVTTKNSSPFKGPGLLEIPQTQPILCQGFIPYCITVINICLWGNLAFCIVAVSSICLHEKIHILTINKQRNKIPNTRNCISLSTICLCFVIVPDIELKKIKSHSGEHSVS